MSDPTDTDDEVIVNTPERLRVCPSCEAVDSFETHLRIDLDDVEIKPYPVGHREHERMDGEMVAFTIAGSANDTANGIVIEEAEVSCRDCGHELAVLIPWSITDHWTFNGVTTLEPPADPMRGTIVVQYDGTDHVRCGIVVKSTMPKVGDEQKWAHLFGPNDAYEDVWTILWEYDDTPVDVVCSCVKVIDQERTDELRHQLDESA